jgi:hypothetical protein
LTAISLILFGLSFSENNDNFRQIHIELFGKEFYSKEKDKGPEFRNPCYFPPPNNPRMPAQADFDKLYKKGGKECQERWIKLGIMVRQLHGFWLLLSYSV